MRNTLIALAVGLAVGFSTGWKVHVWREAAETLENQSQAETDRLARQANTIRVERKAIARREKDAEALATILRRIDRDLPKTACVLPPDWRVLHDAAARGEDPPAAGLSDAAPVPAATAAETVARNYSGARRNEDQLADCQRYIRENGLYPEEEK